MKYNSLNQLRSKQRARERIKNTPKTLKLNKKEKKKNKALSSFIPLS